METTIQATLIQKTVKLSRVKSLTSQEFWATCEFNRFGISPTILTIVVCISAFAAAFAITGSVMQLALVGFPTAIFIASIIAVAPMRAMFTLALITTVIDLAVIGIHLIG
jgi:hypothetical protein